MEFDANWCLMCRLVELGGVWCNVVPYGQIRATWWSLVQIGVLRRTLVPSGADWCRSGAFWCRLVEFGASRNEGPNDKRFSLNTKLKTTYYWLTSCENVHTK